MAEQPDAPKSDNDDQIDTDHGLMNGTGRDDDDSGNGDKSTSSLLMENFVDSAGELTIEEPSQLSLRSDRAVGSISNQEKIPPPPATTAQQMPPLQPRYDPQRPSILSSSSGSNGTRSTPPPQPKMTNSLPRPRVIGNRSSTLPATAGVSGAETVPKSHQRQVSWGMDVPSNISLNRRDKMDSLRVSDLETGALSPNFSLGGTTTSNSRVTMRTLNARSPLETEAETHMQTALEELDPTTPGPSQAQMGILGDIPVDIDPSQFEDKSNHEEKDNSHSSRTSMKTAAKFSTRLPSRRPSGSHKKTKSGVMDLWDLAKELKSMQARDSLHASNGNEEEEELSNTDALAKHAVNLVRRHQANKTSLGSFGGLSATQEKPNEESDEDEDDMPAAVKMGADHFKALLQRAKTKRDVTKGMASQSSETQSQAGMGHVDDAPDATDASDGDKPVDRRASEPERKNSSKIAKTKISGKAATKLKFKEFEDWLMYRRMSLLRMIKILLFYIIIPATGLAAILYYLADNPPCGNGICRPKLTTNSTAIRTIISASASWWILFVFVRQVITLALALVTQAFIVDYLALRTKLFIHAFGPLVTLFTVQSKGWPLTVFLWGLYDFALLYGPHDFARHWLYWQYAIDMMNSNNPPGRITQSVEYRTILIVAIVISFITAIKRCWLGLILGKQTFVRYGEELAKVMKKSLLIGQIASLGRNIELSNINLDDFWFHVNTNDDDSVVESSSCVSPSNESNREFRLNDPSIYKSRKAKLNELLGEWDEPEDTVLTPQKANIGSIIQFRQSLSCLNSSVPFSAAFGPATTRLECVIAAEGLYNRLHAGTPGSQDLAFDVLAMVALDKSGELDDAHVKDLVRIFRPDRDGNLSTLDFVKSVDAVYKELRLLRASISNSSKLQHSFEVIFNIFFYIVVVLISVAAVGIDPFVLFSSISAFVVGFAFMIGTACSKYLEGLLLIFVRRPYDIGDRIHVSNPETDLSISGSSGWIVKDIDLFTTTVIFGATNEVATYSNGSLAASRIVNAARSPKASLVFFLKFPIDAPYEKLQIFKTSIEKFIQARPREWAAFLAFRSTRVEADQGYVEYIVVGQHRESWQSIGALLESKAELNSFTLELSKKMHIQYHQPPMPVDLSVRQPQMQQQVQQAVNSNGESIMLPTIDRQASDANRWRTMSTDGVDHYDQVAGMFGSPSK